MNKIIVLAVILLSACATQQPDFTNQTREGIQSATTIKKTEFDRLTTIEAPPMRAGNGILNERMVFLRGFKSPSVMTHQVYVRMLYTADRWRYFQTASLVGGEQKRLTSIDRRVVSCSKGIGCSYIETVGIEVTEAELKAGDGFQLRLNAQSGDEEFVTIRRSYIEGYLAAAAGA